MAGNFANARLAVATMSILVMVAAWAQPSQCSQSSATGHWAYTYNGTVCVPDAGRFGRDMQAVLPIVGER